MVYFMAAEDDGYALGVSSSELESDSVSIDTSELVSFGMEGVLLRTFHDDFSFNPNGPFGLVPMNFIGASGLEGPAPASLDSEPSSL